MRHKLNTLQKSIIATELPLSNNCLILKKGSVIFFPQWQVLLVVVISTCNTSVSVFTIFQVTDITLHSSPIFFFPHSPFVHSEFRFIKVFHYQQARKQDKLSNGLTHRLAVTPAFSMKPQEMLLRILCYQIRAFFPLFPSKYFLKYFLNSLNYLKFAQIY